MNAKRLFPAMLLGLAVTAQAEDSSPKSGGATSANAPTNGNPITADWERVLVEKDDTQGVRIGRKDWRIKGPVVEGVRRQRATGDRSFGQRLLGLPIIRLFVPQPIPAPSGDRNNLHRDDEGDRPWIAIVENAASGRTAGDPRTHEARPCLVSIGR